jgi:hypothetical protein
MAINERVRTIPPPPITVITVTVIVETVALIVSFHP